MSLARIEDKPYSDPKDPGRQSRNDTPQCTHTHMVQARTHTHMVQANLDTNANPPWSRASQPRNVRHRPSPKCISTCHKAHWPTTALHDLLRRRILGSEAQVPENLGLPLLSCTNTLARGNHMAKSPAPPGKNQSPACVPRGWPLSSSLASTEAKPQLKHRSTCPKLLPGW